MDFPDILKAYRDLVFGVTAWYPINTAILEANIGRWKLTRRGACRFHDLKYSIPKIFQVDNPFPIPLHVP
jgi:hypothetical protein